MTVQFICAVSLLYICCCSVRFPGMFYLLRPVNSLAPTQVKVCVAKDKTLCGLILGPSVDLLTEGCGESGDMDSAFIYVSSEPSNFSTNYRLTHLLFSLTCVLCVSYCAARYVLRSFLLVSLWLQYRAAYVYGMENDDFRSLRCVWRC